MKILVTGTAGFIGYHLAKKLLMQGNQNIEFKEKIKQMNSKYLLKDS